MADKELGLPPWYGGKQPAIRPETIHGVKQGNGSMRDAKVLITGGLGFIGRCATRMLVEQGHRSGCSTISIRRFTGKCPGWQADDCCVIRTWKCIGETCVILLIGPR